MVDGLFERGYVHEALQAQRYAVPLLADVGSQIRQNKGIQNTYDENLILNVWRSLLDAIDAYVILKEPNSTSATLRSSASTLMKWLRAAVPRRIVSPPSCICWPGTSSVHASS